MGTVSSTTPTSCQDAKSPREVEMPAESIDHLEEESHSVPSLVISTESSETNGDLMVLLIGTGMTEGSVRTEELMGEPAVIKQKSNGKK